MKTTTTWFTRELFQFLVDLKFHNDRGWFNANKERYQEHFKKPMLHFIEELAPRLAKVNPAYIADARSLFRIYRDTRFSADKTPYKTHAAAQFRHRAASGDVHAPGFYFHLEPGDCSIGGGLWMPEPGPLALVRKRIASRDRAWLKLKASKMPLWDADSLKRPPRGFDPEHPLVEDLKRRHFVTWVDLTDKQVCGPDLMERFLDGCRRTDPLVRFLCRALGLEA